MPRRHVDHQPVDLTALYGLKLLRNKAVVGCSAIGSVRVLGEFN